MAKAHADRLERTLRQTFARNLLAAREKAELSQQALGDMADVSPNYLGRAERGQANVSLDLIARLAGVLGISPTSLLADGH
jgi:transcriptional regulator with XRE-family HTH domain